MPLKAAEAEAEAEVVVVVVAVVVAVVAENPKPVVRGTNGEGASCGCPRAPSVREGAVTQEMVRPYG
ncbi:hypothetical protein SAMN05443248_0627 [Bradyrhizobium erythrophlei]|uniref:Uncharacterized protein n=1 Tax=Bradyrhizobium erythrophlei TaxID=1437360 RepID=A0A1M5HTI4_9BRAD|nr:hypothetical protein SAMN05443248_0627 [Bradyrhizobium erythrophlei]